MLAVAIIAIWAVAIAASVANAETFSETINVPGSLWVALIAGVVQGLIWYGAVSAKLTALAERLRMLETERRADSHQFEARFESLLNTFIKSMKGKS